MCANEEVGDDSTKSSQNTLKAGKGKSISLPYT